MKPASRCQRCDKNDWPLRRGMCQSCYRSYRTAPQYRSSYVDAAPVRTHVQLLIDSNQMSLRQVALAAGLHESAVHYLLNGRPHQKIPPARRVAAKTANALLAVHRKEDTPVSALSDAVNNLRITAAEAQSALDGDSNDAEHYALIELVWAAQGVVESWSK